MSGVTFASSLLSVSVFAVLTASGVAAGWIQRDSPETERGKQVAVLPLTEPEPAEEVVAALANPEYVPPQVLNIPSAPTSRRLADKPLSADAAAGAMTAPVPTLNENGEQVLVITLPRSGGSNIKIIPPTPKKTLSLKGEPGGVPKITPVAVAGYGPIKALAYAPVAAITEAGPHGPLPRVSDDGKRARDLYARPFANAEGRPMIALVLGGMALKRDASAYAIEQLPGPVALSFAPYPSDLDNWSRAARAAGHEVLVELPMEPFDFPQSNPGEKALLTGLDDRENLDRLNWLLARFPGYVGVTNYLGNRLAAEPEKIQPILDAVSQRGLLFLETGTRRRSRIGELSQTVGLPHARANQVIDPKGFETDAETVMRRLDALIEVAKAEGSAIGVGLATPVTVDAIVEWSRTLESRGVVLAPLSAVIL